MKPNSLEELCKFYVTMNYGTDAEWRNNELFDDSDGIDPQFYLKYYLNGYLNVTIVTVTELILFYINSRGNV